MLDETIITETPPLYSCDGRIGQRRALTSPLKTLATRYGPCLLKNDSVRLGYCQGTFGSHSEVRVKGLLSTYLCVLFLSELLSGCCGRPLGSSLRRTSLEKL